MAKRLQVILTDHEYREIWRMARSQGVSVAEWVRQALSQAHRRAPVEDFTRKLEAIRAASKYEFPVGGIGQMLSEIEQRYENGQLP